MAVFTADELADLAVDLQADLIETAIVYGENANGLWTTVLNQSLACRLDVIGKDFARDTVGRTLLASRRVLTWDLAYVLPEGSRVTINAESWATIRGTFVTTYVDDGTVISRDCDVERITQ